MSLAEELHEALSHIAELERQNKILELKNATTLANNLCPDHRDKQLGKPCLACTIETLERQQAVLVKALEDIKVNAGRAEFVWLRARAELAAVKSSKYVPPKPNHQVQSLIEAARCLGVAQAKGDHTQHWESAVADLSVALNAAVKPAGQEGGEQPDTAREYEVWQDDIMVASASGHRPDAIREILHYAAQYQQDGPVQIFEVRRQLCSAEELVFAQNGLTEAKKADVMINGLTEAETAASASVAGLMQQEQWIAKPAGQKGGE